MTVILEPTLENITKCADLLSLGLLVSFPTETVYGLGAKGLNQEAIAKIYTVKKRPKADPLILHFCSTQKAFPYLRMSSFQEKCFLHLANRFWPGPLTIIVPKSPEIPSCVTGGSSFVGIRIPNHTIAFKLLSLCDFPVAAPSANLFSHISPTKASHVYDDFPQEKELTILDTTSNSNCDVGIESTIIKLEEDRVVILRLGYVGIDEIKKSLSQDFSGLDVVYQNKIIKENESPESSGQFLTHYSPFCETYLYEDITAICKNTLGINYKKAIAIDFGARIFTKRDLFLAYMDLSAEGNVLEASRNLFSFLRESEKQKGVEYIFLPKVFQNSTAVSMAIYDRIYRASSGKIIK